MQGSPNKRSGHGDSHFRTIRKMSSTGAVRGIGVNSKFFRWRSLKTRVTLFTLAIFVTSIWAVSLYASRTMQDDMQRVFGEQQFATVSVVAADINAEMGDHLQALERIAVDITPAIIRNPKALQALLA